MVKSEDDDAFEVLVREHQARILAIALNVLGDLGEAEDVAQDVFAAAFRNWASPPENWSSWLNRTATNAAIDRLRRARRLAHCKDLAEIGQHPAPPATASEDAKQTLIDLWNLLPNHPLDVFLYVCDGQFKPESLAAAFDMSVAAVRQRTYRVRNLLRDLRPDHPDD